MNLEHRPSGFEPEQKEKFKKYNAIVVSPGFENNEHRAGLAWDSRLREIAAAELFKAGKAERVVVGGAKIREMKKSFAELMRAELIRRGVPDTQIDTEEYTFDTPSQIDWIQKHISQYGDKVGFVTDPEQAKHVRALLKGFKLTDKVDILTDEDIIREYVKNPRVDGLFKKLHETKYWKNWKRREKILELFTELVDPKGKLIQKITGGRKKEKNKYVETIGGEKLAEFREAFEMVLQDKPTEPVDAIFFHAMSYGDDDEMFPLAASYLREGKAKYIVVNGSNGRGFYDPTPGKAWAGKEDYARRLKELGVTEDQIKVSKPGLHTRQQNDFYLDLAKDNGWKTAVTLNQPQQLLRAQLGQIKVMEEKGYWMRVYAAYPEPWDAAKVVRGSQGEEQERRWKKIGKDYDRILTYQKQGMLVSFDEFFDYMKKRSEIE